MISSTPTPWPVCLVAILLGFPRFFEVQSLGNDYLCPNLTDPNCSCGPKSDGWTLACHEASDATVITYSITYTIYGEFDVVCNEEVPFREAMFAQFKGDGRNESDIYKFSKCPLPQKVSLESLFQGTSVRVLAFDCDTCTPEDVVPKDLFRNMQKVRELTLSRFYFRVLPGDLLHELVNLEYLSLQQNNITRLPEDLFHNLHQLKYLWLFNNPLETIPEGLFRNLARLETLVLKTNSLKVVSVTTFGALHSLTDLELNDNFVESLPAGVFSNNSKLENLNLQNNRLEDIADNIFGNNTSLITIDFSYNTGLSILPETFLHVKNNLTKINFSHCNLSTIPEKLLSSVYQLETLVLAYNRIGNLPSAAFQSLSLLGSLDLSYNRLSALPNKLFLKTTSLNTLILSYNQFEIFPGDCFADLLNLKVLHFEGNQLLSLDGDREYAMPNLRELYLQNNNIVSLEHNQLFGYRYDLSIVDLSRNNLIGLPDISSSVYRNLTSISFSFNQIQSFETPLTPGLIELQVYLDNNNITFIDVANIKLSDTGQIKKYIRPAFHVKNNPFNCDCSLLSFKGFAENGGKIQTNFVDFDETVCNKPDELSGKKIGETEDEAFICSIEKRCPTKCRCLLRGSTNTIEVDCRGQSLTALPSTVPDNTSVLLIQNNSLTELENLKEPIWKNLRTLTLEGNQIMSASNWYFPASLENMSLAMNDLKWLPERLINWAGSANSRQINISGNPWVCDCDGIPLVNFMKAYSNKIPDRSFVLCGSPLVLLNLSVISLSERQVCSQESSYPVKYIVIICCCSIVGLLTSICCVLYYRNKRTILAYVYIHFYKVFSVLFRESDLDEEKQFHAFVSYSSCDRDVVTALLDELELKEPPFRLCIHERDWMPGQHIIWNIVMSVQNSRRTILVLSKDFLNSVWFQLEFRIAYYQMLEDKVDRLIVVVNGDLPDRKELDKDLQVLLSTKSYLEWNERWFWEKLRYALPHKKTKPSQNTPAVQMSTTEMIRELESRIMSLIRETLTSNDHDQSGFETIELNELQDR